MSDVGKSYRPLRIQALKPAAKQLSQKMYIQSGLLERDVLAWYQRTAAGASKKGFGGGVIPPGIAKDYSQQDLDSMTSYFLRVFTPEEIIELDSVLEERRGKSSAHWLPFYNRQFRAGLDNTYWRIMRFAGAVSREDRAKARTVSKPSDFLFDPNTRRLRALRENGLELIRSKITIDHKARALKVLIHGFENDLPVGTIATAIRREVGTGAFWHWNRLVRTESQFALQASFLERSIDAGIQYEELSIASTACKICQAAKGVYELGKGPSIPLHPNCRCSKIPYFSLPRRKKVRKPYEA